MRVLSLFSGIGGLDLAAEWAGMEIVAFCEIDPYAVKVLKRRWPNVPVYNDVRELTRERLERDGILPIDIITGGFPCQDVSYAGKRVGFHDQDGEVTRSGLWTEYARLIGEIRPRWVVAENVRGLLSILAAGIVGGGFGIVLRDLADLGYRAGWCCYGACDVGGFHRRERVFVVAHSGGGRPYIVGTREQKRFSFFSLEDGKKWASTQGVLSLNSIFLGTKPNRGILRNNDGFPEGLDRMKALGNAVVPQQAYPIFRAIMEEEIIRDYGNLGLSIIQRGKRILQKAKEEA